MRTLFLLLLLANFTLFGYIQLDNMSTGEGVRLHQQLQPENIRVLTPQQVAALGPEKTASLADVCAEWGPFSENDRVRALADLEPLGLGRLISTKRLDSPTSFWVYIAPFSSRIAAERGVAVLRAQGITDVSVVDSGNGRFAISLGVFRTEDAANGLAADLVGRGITNVRAGPRPQPGNVATLVIRDPPAAAIARLKDLQSGYAGADVRIGNCDKTS